MIPKRHCLLKIGYLLIAQLLIGCQCQKPEILATLKEKNGAIDRDFRYAMERWEKANLGAEFRLGDGVRSKAASDAVLSLNEGSMLRLTPNSQLRFLAVKSKQGQSGNRIDIETGTAELLVGEKDLFLMTSVGTATIASGSVVKLRKSDAGIAFEVEIGKATFFDKNNTANEVAAGEGILVNIGAAVLEKFAIETAAEGEQDTEPAPEPSETNTDDVEDEIAASEDEAGGGAKGERHHPDMPEMSEGPPKADFRVSPGESFVVHAPAPPVAVEFDTTRKCPNGAAVQIGKKWVAKGTPLVRAVFPTGRHRYRLRCLDGDGTLGDDAGKGRVHVLKDAGVARLPGNPPTSFVETDGRRYKIMYQTRQPAIEVSWPRAPKGQKYKLHIDGRKEISTPKARYTLASRALPEGTHQIKFEAIGSMARTSRTTTVEIRFDNAAPKASLTAPANGSFGPGATVEVKGTAMANWTIKLIGGSVSKDEQHRFRGQVDFSGNYMSIALRLSHVRRGVHYYIRRARGQGL